MNSFTGKINWKTTTYRGELGNTINGILTTNLRILCREILRSIPKTMSIYLTGSYSRGEGSVLVEEGKVKILSDYDLLVISDAQPYLLRLRSNKLNDALFSIGLYNKEMMLGHPVAESAVMNRKQIQRVNPTLFNYELRTAKLIYGFEILESVPKINASDIPQVNGLRLLFDRMLGAIIPFSVDFLHENPAEMKSRHLMFETAKLLTGCRDALLILNKVYFPTEKQKQNHFEFNYLTYQSLIQETDFLELAKKAHRYRLTPSKELEKNAVDLSLKAFRTASIVLKIYLEKLYGIEESEWSTIIDNFENIQFLPPSHNLASIFLTYQKNKKLYNYPSRTPLNKILGVLTLLVLSVGENGLNEETLEKAQGIMGGNVLRVKAPVNKRELWMLLKDYVRQSYASPFPSPPTIQDYFQAIIATTIQISRGMLRI